MYIREEIVSDGLGGSGGGEVGTVDSFPVTNRHAKPKPAQLPSTWGQSHQITSNQINPIPDGEMRKYLKIITDEFMKILNIYSNSSIDETLKLTGLFIWVRQNSRKSQLELVLLYYWCRNSML